MSRPRAAAVDLRPATADDLPAAARLVDAAGLPLAGFDACVAGGSAIIVAGPDGTLLGAAAIEGHGPCVLLRSVAVDPSARGRGIGRALVERALVEARTAGAREAWLLTTTAASWFAGLGWEPADRSAAPPAIAASVEFASACPASALAMRRAL